MFIRQENTFKCDACGKVKEDEVHKYMNMYACLHCNFFIHKNCIYLPNVIKLTRHPHCLFRTFQIPDWNTNCPICNELFVYGCGGYICTDKACGYKLHSYCATRKDVWDGKDVEREEISNSEDVTFSSLEEVDNNTFRHVSHHHDLVRLYVNDEEEDDHERICQACILRIDFDSFLSCKECDFSLHDTCARLRQKLEHAFHVHPLTLEVNIKEGFFTCSTCERESCGFMYRCCQEECEFKIDAKCVSLADPLYKGLHKHPLTLLDSEVHCFECRFHVETKRATLPLLVKCKYDTHPLTLCFLEYISWGWSLSCEICEIKIQYGFYTNYQEFYGCADCNTIVHVDCAIGKYPYMKPGRTIKVNDFEIEIASNSCLSRPICHACHCICQDKVVFINKRDAIFLCSIKCITSSSKACQQS